MIYIIADTHFSHNNIIQYCNRPFPNTSSMNDYIVKKWNETIQPNDIVFHLGDVGFGLKEQLMPLVTNLNGHKILLRGNHDYSRGLIYWRELGFEIIYKKGNVTLQQFLEDIKQFNNENSDCLYQWSDKVIFSHQPIQCSDDILNIHGHIHNVPLDTSIYNPKNHFCVSVELIDYTPILLTDILKENL